MLFYRGDARFFLSITQIVMFYQVFKRQLNFSKVQMYGYCFVAPQSIKYLVGGDLYA
jgi:hypothetical protein